MLSASTVSLTLVAARFAALHNHAPRKAEDRPLRATFGHPLELPWDQADATLAAASPRLLIACLAPTSPILVWHLDAVLPAQRGRCDWEFANAAAYLQGKAEMMDLEDDSPLLVCPVATPTQTLLRDLRDWVGSVAFINAGWTIQRYQGRVWLTLLGADDTVCPPAAIPAPG